MPLKDAQTCARAAHSYWAAWDRESDSSRAVAVNVLAERIHALPAVAKLHDGGPR